ncbi:MAG: site-specific integrase, partial [Verrucomicrobiota bacterium]
FLPTVYLAAACRSTHAASNTLKCVGRAIMHLYAWAAIEDQNRLESGDFLDGTEVKGFDIEDRFRNGDFLDDAEIESLARACDQKYNLLLGPQITQMTGTRQVAPQTVSVRLFYIAKYLDWLAQRRIKQLPLTSIERSSLELSLGRMLTMLKSRDPAYGQDPQSPKEGLSKESLAKLLEVVCPVGYAEGKLSLDSKGQYRWSPENPFLNPDIRIRNCMMILLLLNLGIRRGELLGLKVSDINFASNKIAIRRAPDDPTDPRNHEPNTKTLAREVALNDFIGTMVRDYVLKVRRNWAPRKRDHAFLFVARGGAPLSIPSVDKMWQRLRMSVPELPKDIASHILRHTWNDLFSERIEQEKVPESREEQMRSNQMGWSQTSKSATVYTRRYVRAATNKASLEMQKAQFHPKNTETEK